MSGCSHDVMNIYVLSLMLLIGCISKAAACQMVPMHMAVLELQLELAAAGRVTLMACR